MNSWRRTASLPASSLCSCANNARKSGFSPDAARVLDRTIVGTSSASGSASISAAVDGIPGLDVLVDYVHLTEKSQEAVAHEIAHARRALDGGPGPTEETR